MSNINQQRKVKAKVFATLDVDDAFLHTVYSTDLSHPPLCLIMGPVNINHRFRSLKMINPSCFW